MTNPVSVIDTKDPGDETQRNFRYQHAYGVILLIGAACNKLDYISLYAEHHEDFLCEKRSGKFVGYQIKTRKPEEGVWDLSDEPLRKSIRRFIELNQKYDSYLDSLVFVSNSGFSNPGSDIKDKVKLSRSPQKFTEHVSKCSDAKAICPPFDESFEELRRYCNCTSGELIAVIKKLDLVIGPERNSFDAEITATHLPHLPDCSSLPIHMLNAVRDELVQKVYYASSLKIDDPSKHWYPINRSSIDDPVIKSKKLTVDMVNYMAQDRTAPPFRYYNTHPTIQLGDGQGKLSILRQKMERGGLHHQIQTMERRSLSAEQKLMEYAVKNPTNLDSYISQLVGVVKGECDEAYHHAIMSGEPIGHQMLDTLYKCLKEKADKHPALVMREPYETLIGIAGLLTGDCQVWWSEPFPIASSQ